MAAFDKVACPFCVSRRSIMQFAVEQCSPGYQRTSPAYATCCPLYQTSYNVHIYDTAVFLTRTIHNELVVVNICSCVNLYSLSRLQEISSLVAVKIELRTYNY